MSLRRLTGAGLQPGLALQLPCDLGFEGREVIENLLRLVEPAEVALDARELVPPVGTHRLQLGVLPQRCDGLVQAVCRDQRQREAVVRAVVLRVARDRRAERRNRGVVVVQLLQQERAVEVRVGGCPLYTLDRAG